LNLKCSAFGTREYRRFAYTGKVNLLAGINKLALLSVAIGLPDGLKGEAMDVASPNGISSVAWMQSAIVVQRNQPLTWHKSIRKLHKLILMLLKEMNHWHWIWRVWEKVKYGSMDRVLDNTGLLSSWTEYLKLL
ncbi:Beta-galactosidase 3, partial [Glycine soja]